MKILIVEDDEHKSSQILNVIDALSDGPSALEVVDNVMHAVRFIAQEVPSKIILDMSLPSHKAQPGQGTPVPLPTGGMEVLFELIERSLMDIPILILTQYPEIEIENEPFPVEDAGLALCEEYGFTSLDTCYYDRENSANWKQTTKVFLRNK